MAVRTTIQITDLLSDHIDRIVRPVSRRLNAVGVAFILVMVLLAATNVFLRYFFGSPLKAIIEIEELMLVTFVFLGVSHTTISGGHVSINMLSSKFSARVRAVIETFNSLLGVGLFAVVTWRSLLYAVASFRQNEASWTIHLPYGAFILVVTVGCLLVSLVLLGNLFRSIGDIARHCSWPYFWLFISFTIACGLSLGPAILNMLQIHPDRVITGLAILSLLLVLMFLGMPIAFVLMLTGSLGLWYLKGLDSTLHMIPTYPFITVKNFLFTVIPFFILMGMFSLYAKIGRDLYDTAYKWIGQMPGGLAMASIAGCAAFGAICGNSQAASAAIGAVAIPEMKKYRYDPALAAGSVATGGTIAVMIPPSIAFIVYGIVTQVPIGKLFIAGIIPGILHAILYMAMIYFRCRRTPKLAPRCPPIPFKEKIGSLKNTWAVIVLFTFVIGSIYFGVCTPTEAGAIGAFGALAISLFMRRLSWKDFTSALLDTGNYGAMIFLLLIGAAFVGSFLGLSQIPSAVSTKIASLEVSPYIILLFICLLYVVFGMLLPIVPMIIITLPIFFPIVMASGFNPVWFGVIMVLLVEIGQVTPPMGINVFIIAGITKDIQASTIFRGIAPFLVCDFIALAILIAFPQISLFLPSTMK